ncbi:MAG: hypothetical protein QOI79_1102 [Mycobacterium sp.]|jgi:hypothetical protein|nr:hypothetical protein [Mycobacterium sp.]
MSIMCSELSAQAHVDAVLERRLDELLQRAAASICADVSLCQPTAMVPAGARLAQHLDGHTSRRSNAG